MIRSALSRRALLALPFAASCTSSRAAYRGYAFIANEEGRAVAAVDLEALAVARHISLDSAPVQVIALEKRPSVYALTPESGSIQEIQADHLSFARKLAVGSRAIAMSLSSEHEMYVLTSEPKALVRVALDRFAVDWKLPLSEDPHAFDLSADGKMAAICSGQSVRIVDLEARRIGNPLGTPADIGAVRFLSDSRTLVAANRAERMLSIYDVASSRLIADLPIAVRPDNLCFSNDGGQLFITGEGVDGVVIVYPYRAEVAKTVLAGHAPGAMAASEKYLFVASPQSGQMIVLEIGKQEVIAVVNNVGDDPGFIVVTHDDLYTLVLNRKSGDVAVFRVDLIKPNRRYKERAAKLLTVIPVGSKPVSAAVRGV